MPAEAPSRATTSAWAQDHLAFGRVDLHGPDDRSPMRTRLVRAASLYLAGVRGTPDCRFDAVLLDALDPDRITWLPGAFDAG